MVGWLRGMRATIVADTRAAAFFFTLFFFIITRAVFPTHLYPDDYRGVRPAQYEIFQNAVTANNLSTPFSDTTSVKNAAIYNRAAKALIPWFILSPWALLHLACSGGCDVLPIFWLGFLASFFLIYKIALYKLLSRLIGGKFVSTFLILGLIWIGFNSLGLLYIKYNFVDNINAFNDVLRKLERISGGTPFPEETDVSRGLSDKPVFVNAKARYLHLDYNNPATRSKEYSRVFGESYSGEMLFYDTPQPYSGEEVCKRVEGSLLFEIADNVFSCEKKFNNRKSIIYAGYIDSGHSIFVAALPSQENSNNFTGDKFVPTLFLHYLKHKTL